MEFSNFYDIMNEYQAFCSKVVSTAEKSGICGIDSLITKIKENNLIDQMIYIML